MSYGETVWVWGEGTKTVFRVRNTAPGTCRAQTFRTRRRRPLRRVGVFTAVDRLVVLSSGYSDPYCLLGLMRRTDETATRLAEGTAEECSTVLSPVALMAGIIGDVRFFQRVAPPPPPPPAAALLAPPTTTTTTTSINVVPPLAHPIPNLRTLARPTLIHPVTVHRAPTCLQSMRRLSPDTTLGIPLPSTHLLLADLNHRFPVYDCFRKIPRCTESRNLLGRNRFFQNTSTPVDQSIMY